MGKTDAADPSCQNNIVVLSSKKLNIQLNAKQERRRVQENYTTICPTALRYSLRKEGKGWTKPGEK